TMLGKGFENLSLHLDKALDLTMEIGDRRSQALAHLHLGRAAFFMDRKREALDFFAEGKKEVESLGDPDIIKISSEFIGYYYLIQGMYGKGQSYFDRVDYLSSDDNFILGNPFFYILYGTCTMNTGDFRSGIGTLTSYMRLANARQWHGPACVARSLLGIMLVFLRKKEEALYHLHRAEHKAKQTKNAFAIYWARIGIARQFFYDGRIDKTYELYKLAFEEAKLVGLQRYLVSSWILEMLVEFDRANYPPILGWSFSEHFHICMIEPNVHLRGAALRLRAEEKMRRGVYDTEVVSDLAASESYLEQAGDPIELAKTWLAAARLHLLEEKPSKAVALAKKARQHMAPYDEEFFPADLRHLVIDSPPVEAGKISIENFVKRYVEFLNTLRRADTEDELLNRAMRGMNQLFGAERGAFFWINSEEGPNNLQLRASCNLTKQEVASSAFKDSMGTIYRAFKENRPLVIRFDPSSYVSLDDRIISILCLPIVIGSSVRGVLYYDNCYLKDPFDFLSPDLMKALASLCSSYTGIILQQIQHREKINVLASGETLLSGKTEEGQILTQDDAMLRLLQQADRVAGSDSTILVMGETGTGKELLSIRVHKMSSRRRGPFVLVDSTTIPENLVESELFGYEKGAFTGADRRKRGRIELSDGGTLFVDEVGDLPLTIQAKLLRVLEEKSFHRLGGTSAVKADFRLVVATNRDLSHEVASGRFREDLYYRLNVVALTIPPLRDRGDDVLLLARYFFRKYARKYKKSELRITPEDESRLMSYNWPGNVRELKNVLERAVILSTDEKIQLSTLSAPPPSVDRLFETKPTMDELQRTYITHILETTGGQVGGPKGAAAILGMPRTTLQKRLKKLGLR
ncbi:MAG: sigma 54-interacting transcriptional regulator, partial [Deltaproteobacteria bacterium]|nr:sigma 54-interacting transcriptional regulator [Deltaproteobacteria bacterium]